MEWLLQAPILLFSLIFHEYSHGFVAFHRGDDTAALSGRLSFDPLDHIDPVGTVLIPVICVMHGWPMFGWARPVPVNPRLLRDPRWDQLKVAFAGPASNLLLATAAAVAFRVTAAYSGIDLLRTLAACFFFAIQINLLLAFFNFIPVFPLDGSKVLGAVLPTRALELYEEHAPYGGLILTVLVVTGATRFLILPGVRLFMGLYGALHLV